MIIKDKKTKLIKWCWVAKETRYGWKVKFACNGSEKDFPLSGIILTSIEEVETIFGDSGKVVFIHLKNSKYDIK